MGLGSGVGSGYDNDNDHRNPGPPARQLLRRLERDGDLYRSAGADGVPERTMAEARRKDACREGGRSRDGFRVVGVVIVDVRTGEEYAWPL